MSTQPNAIQEIQAKSAAAPQQPVQPQQQPPTQAPGPQQDASQPDDDSVSAGSDEKENATVDSVNLHRAFSKMNEAITAMLDGLAVPRVATIPHQKDQQTAEHFGDIQRALATSGSGLTKAIGTATHSKYGPNGGSTVFHSAQKARETVVPKDNKLAQAAIDACKSFVSKVKKLIGETPEITRANSQLALVGKQGGAGMSASDLAVALINIPGPVINAVARKHSGIKPGGHAVHLRAPYEPKA